MVVDALKKYLIRKLLAFNLQKFMPGFITVHYDYKKTRIFERDILLPEDFVAELEKEAVRRHGEELIKSNISAEDFLAALGLEELFLYHYRRNKGNLTLLLSTGG